MTINLNFKYSERQLPLDLNVIKSDDKFLHMLAAYNRRIGLPSILIASIIAAIILGVSTELGLILQGSPIGAVVTILLCLLVIDSVLILSNFLVMNYLFKRILNRYQKQGLPYASLIGVEALNDTSVRETQFAVLLTVLSTASLSMYLLGGTSTEVIFIYLSMGSALIAFGFSIIKREHVLDPDELLRLYVPDNWPIVLTTDIFLETFIDPFNRLKFREYLSDLSRYVREDLDLEDALSKITVLLFQNLYGALKIEDVRSEVSELFKPGTDIMNIEQHPIFGFNRLKIILNKTKKIVPEFSRLLDRLFVEILDDLPGIKESNYYIDAEVTPDRNKGQVVKCFVFLYNNDSTKTQTFSVSYASGSTGPLSSEVTLTLPVRHFNLPAGDTLPIYTKSGSDSANDQEQDIVGFMSRMLEDARIILFCFEVKENGNKPIVVSVKDKETGQLVYGRTFQVLVSNNFSDLYLKLLGGVSVFIGIILPFLRLMGLHV